MLNILKFQTVLTRKYIKTTTVCMPKKFLILRRTILKNSNIFAVVAESVHFTVKYLEN